MSTENFLSISLGKFFHIKTVMKGAFNFPKRISAKTKASKGVCQDTEVKLDAEKPQTVHIINEPVYYNILTNDWF